jgi:hypothetical protein
VSADDGERFWLVKAASATRDCWVRLVDDQDSDEVVLAAMTGDAPERFGLEVFNRGTRHGDFLWTGGGAFTVVSDRVVETLRDVGPTGWHAVPADVRFRNGDRLDGYHVLLVTGACDDFTRGRREGSTGVDPTPGWDGSDVFWIRDLPNFCFWVTDRVRRAFDRAGLTRVECEAASRYPF